MLCLIVPTLNSGDSLSALLKQAAGHVDEIIIADGGSSDETLDVGAQFKARFAIGGGGRGAQLSRGARWSQTQNLNLNQTDGRHEWLLFLHTDSRLSEGWYGAVTQHMSSEGNKAAYFRFALDDSGFWPRFFEWAVALRCKALALPYGDQGLLIRRDLYDDIGGYPDWPLFEDVSVVRALGRRRLRAIKLPLITDAAKFRRDGYVRRGLKNISLATRYFSGAKPVDLARRYR